MVAEGYDTVTLYCGTVTLDTVQLIYILRKWHLTSTVFIDTKYKVPYVALAYGTY